MHMNNRDASPIAPTTPNAPAHSRRKRLVVLGIAVLAILYLTLSLVTFCYNVSDTPTGKKADYAAAAKNAFARPFIRFDLCHRYSATASAKRTTCPSWCVTERTNIYFDNMGLGPDTATGSNVFCKNSWER